MNYWLIKSDPEEWSWDDQVQAGATAWTGVRNPQAQGYLKAMAKGDLALFYHSGSDKSIVGIVQISAAAKADPTDPTGKAAAVDIKTKHALPQPVTLAQIKANKALTHLLLVRQSRLSVLPIDEKSWHILLSGGAQQP